MKNKISVLITGCSSGIGRQTAVYLQAQGYDVYATARRQKDVKALQKMGLKAYMLDVTKNNTIDDCLSEVLSQTDGVIDVLFNNAGYGQMGAMEDITTDLLRRQFETNLFGLFEMTNRVLKIMRKVGRGKISKYAVEGLTDTLRLELNDTDIDVVLLDTGPVTSSFRANAIKNLQTNIDIENSRFKENYHKSIAATKSDVPFSLESLDVAKVVEKIIISKNPKPRYYITKATYILGFCKRILSTIMLDKMLIRI